MGYRDIIESGNAVHIEAPTLPDLAVKVEVDARTAGGYYNGTGWIPIRVVAVVERRYQLDGKHDFSFRDAVAYLRTAGFSYSEADAYLRSLPVA